MYETVPPPECRFRLMETTAPDTVILADGAAPSHEIALEVLRTADRLIACDGAWRTAVALGRVPDAVSGDCDSLDEDDFAELARLSVPVVRDAEQDTNDLCKAFRHALASGGRRIVVLGATGKREDHSIGNVFHLVEFAQACADVRIMTDNGIFSAVLPPGGSFNCREGEPVSVFATFPGTVMESQGLEWPLAGVKFDTLWRGTLNRTVTGVFTLVTDKPVIMYRPYRER